METVSDSIKRELIEIRDLLSNEEGFDDSPRVAARRRLDALIISVGGEEKLSEEEN